MKKYLIILVGLLSIETLSAQFRDSWYNESNPLCGPVKKITTTTYRLDEPEHPEITTIMFDSIGRITQKEEPGVKYVYQYVDNNICWRYLYLQYQKGVCHDKKSLC